MYRSGLLTFTMPAASEALPAGTNVAVGATVAAVSSQFSDAFAASNAVDGDPVTEWSSAGNGDAAFIEIDLGRVVQAVAVGFLTREMSDGSSVTTTFSVTVDGEQTFGPFPAGAGTGSAPVRFMGRVVRFDVEPSTGGNTGAAEVEVYEPS